MTPDTLVEYELVTGLLADPSKLVEAEHMQPDMVSDWPLRVVFQRLKERGGYASPTLFLADMATTEAGREAISRISQATGNEGNHAQTAVDLFADGIKASPIDQLVERVMDEAVKREAERLVRTTRQEDYPTPADYAQHLSTKLADLATRTNKSSGNALERGIDRMYANWEFRQNNPGKIIGYRVNLGDFDHAIGGLKKGTVTIFAGHSNSGKSHLLMHCLMETAMLPADQTGLPPKCVLFSLEMSGASVSTRLTNKLLGFDMDDEMLDADQRAMVPKGKELLRQLSRQERIHLVEPHDCQSYEQIVRAMRRLKQRNAIDIAFIDYLGLIRMTAGTEARHQELAAVTAGFKRLSIELDIPIVLAAQFNREGLKESPSGEPQDYHMADSQAIYHSADNIFGLWVPERHLGKENAGDYKGIAILKTMKARDVKYPDWMFFLAEYDRSTFVPVNDAMKRHLSHPDTKEILNRRRSTARPGYQRP